MMSIDIYESLILSVLLGPEGKCQTFLYEDIYVNAIQSDGDIDRALYR